MTAMAEQTATQKKRVAVLISGRRWSITARSATIRAAFERALDAELYRVPGFVKR